jgi:hypothetical protein
MLERPATAAGLKLKVHPHMPDDMIGFNNTKMRSFGPTDVD